MQRADTIAPILAPVPVEANGHDDGDPILERAVTLELLTQRAREEARRRLAAERAGASTLRADLLDVGELGDLPHPEPLISGVLNRHSYAVLRGRDSTFKTFLMLDWALSLACGRPWLGRATERAPVLYVAGEGAYGLHTRVKAWEEHAGCTVPRGMFTVLPRAVDLYAGHELDPLLEVVAERRAGLVVLDTLRRVSGRADGNGSDMGVVVDNIARIKDATDHGSVAVISHTNKDDRDTRGFSGIEDDADIVWAMKRDEDEQVVTASLAKMKDGADGARVTLRPMGVADSIVLIPATKGSGETAGGRAEVVIVDALDAAEGVADLTGPQLMDATKLPQTSFYRALKALRDRGVVFEIAGRPKRYRLRGEE